MKHVQFGAGWASAEGWLSFDASPTLRIERLPLVGQLLGKFSGNPDRFPADTRYGDIVAGLPVADGSVVGLYASHVLEHIALTDMRVALANSFRMLAPDGVFRLIVPDLRGRAAAYLAAENDPGAAGRFLRGAHLGSEHRARGVVGLVRAALGNSAHLWMYDFAAMKHELEQAGFTAIRRAELGDAADPLFARVEDPGRFVDGEIVEVAIEAKRPG